MDNFKQKFQEEATENLAELEEALLKLEQSPQDSDLIERVFRYMHSLKGGGAMFGFNQLSEFTHHLENVYDQVREGNMQVNQGLLDLTLDAVDHLKVLLHQGDEMSDETQTRHKNLDIQIRKYLQEKQQEPETPQNSNQRQDKTKTFYIYFEPEERLFDNGTNPLFLMDELANLGQAYVMPCLDRIPRLDQLDPQKCYTHWEVVLVTDETEDAIHDVFIFVEDQARIDIHRLSQGNLLENSVFAQFLEQNYRKDQLIGLDAIKYVAQHQESVQPEAHTSQSRDASSGKSGNQGTGGQQNQGKDTGNQKPASPKANGGGKKEDAISSIRVESEKIDHMMNLVSELVTTQARLSLHADQSEDNELEAIAENVQKLTRQLRDNAFDIALVPVETMITRFNRLVRDLSNSLGKKVRLKTEGTETELDKNIIETLTDPLLHILRNCIDHGIETPEERRRAGKPEEGTIMLKAYYSGASVHIQVHDDGKGLDAEKIKQKAVKQKLISPEASLSQKELFDLIFTPGFSTSTNVTDVSGRGVGMDVVKRNLAEIRGEVEIDSEPGTGTTLTVKLPLTLSIIDGLLVQISDNKYVIPLSAVHKIYAANHSDVVDKFNNLIVLDGERIPFFYLRKEFDMPEAESQTEEIVVVQYEGNRIGLVVDTVIGEYQAVLKSLGKMYKYQDMISGATILGDGTVALVMDTNKMIDRFTSDYQQQINVES